MLCHPCQKLGTWKCFLVGYSLNVETVMYNRYSLCFQRQNPVVLFVFLNILEISHGSW